ncbi:hypothetical protein BH10PSE9_BH10PSE9_23040 [soil metagenome]
MNPLTPLHRIFFALVGLFAIWVAVWGLFLPAAIGWAIPWQVPPLHARFIGAVYLAGAVMMGWALIARHLAEVQVAVIMAAIWTGMLLLVSLFHLGEFNYGEWPAYFWFGAYIAYPLMGAWLAYTYRPTPLPETSAAVPDWARTLLVAVGVICIALAACLFFAPAWMASIWPWGISVLLAHIYSGPFLSFGVGSLLLARRRYWIELRIVLVSMAVFGTVVLVASLIHAGLFAPIGPAAVLWFGGFALGTALVAFLSFQSLRPAGNS